MLNGPETAASDGPGAVSPAVATPPAYDHAAGHRPLRRPWWPTRRHPEARRMVAIDAVRGLAVVGMIFAHAGAVGVWGEDASALIGIAHGHSAILFAVVAGLSLGMITGGAEPPRVSALPGIRLRLVGRALALLILGGLLGLMSHGIAVILGSYAVWFIWMMAFLRARPRTLLILGAAHALFGLLAADGLVFILSLLDMTVFDSSAAFVPTEVLAGTYPTLVWVGFVFVGMAVARAGIRNVVVLRRFAVGGLLAFLLAAAPFIIQERSLAPIFGAMDLADDGYSEEGLLDWCLDAERERIFPCSYRDYAEQEVKFTDADYELYWMLYDEMSYGELTALCLDVGDDQLYACTPLEFDALWAALTSEQQLAFAAQILGILGDLGAQYATYSIWTLDPHSGSLFEAVSSGGLAVAIIAGALLLGRFVAARVLMAPFAAVGAMALTAYSAHLVVLAYAPPSWESNLYPLFLSLALIGMCAVWRRVYAAGPLENVVGALADRFATVPAEGRRSR